MDNLEKLATLGTQDTGQTRQKQSRETGNIGYTRRRQTRQKQNDICVGHHHTQTDTNNVNKK